MKSILVSVLVCLCLLGGCANKQEQMLPQGDGFTAVCTISGADLSVSGNLSWTTDGTLRLKLTEPSLFADAEFTLNGGKTTVSYGGITMDLPENEITAKGIAATLGSVLDAVGKDGETLSGETAAGRYSVSKGEDGTVQIELPDAGICCTLSGFENKL